MRNRAVAANRVVPVERRQGSACIFSVAITRQSIMRQRKKPRLFIEKRGLNTRFIWDPLLEGDTL